MAEQLAVVEVKINLETVKELVDRIAGELAVDAAAWIGSHSIVIAAACLIPNEATRQARIGELMSVAFLEGGAAAFAHLVAVNAEIVTDPQIIPVADQTEDERDVNEAAGINYKAGEY